MRIEVARFELSGRRYALLLADIREVLRIPSVVPLPKAPAVIEGIVNIRGTVVPVFDVRKRFGLPTKAAHPTDHLVVAQAGSRLVALRVDRVAGVEDVDPKLIEEVAAISSHIEHVAGVVKLRDGLVLLHDLRKFLDDSESRDLDEALAVPEVAPA